MGYWTQAYEIQIMVCYVVSGVRYNILAKLCVMIGNTGFQISVTLKFIESSEHWHSFVAISVSECEDPRLKTKSFGQLITEESRHWPDYMPVMTMEYRELAKENALNSQPTLTLKAGLSELIYEWGQCTMWIQGEPKSRQTPGIEGKRWVRQQKRPMAQRAAERQELSGRAPRLTVRCPAVWGSLSLLPAGPGSHSPWGQ